MENEIIEEVVQEVPTDPVETETDISVSEETVLPDQETLEDVPETAPDVSPDENNSDSPILDDVETIPEENLEETLTGSEEENGDIENENIYEMENGYENFYESVSGNGIGDGGSTSSDVDTGDGIYVTNYYTMETEEVIPLWENNISNFSTSEMLLFLIFILLLVQFIHNLFKGSHWLKG